MKQDKPTPLLCDSLDFEWRQRAMHLEEYEPEALAWHAAVLERKLALAVKELEEASEPVGYASFEDSVSYRVCCGERSYMPHSKNCKLMNALKQIKGGSDE